MQYFIMTDEQRLGPFSEEQLRELIQSGEVHAQTPVWHKGLQKWTPCGNLFGDMPEMDAWFAMMDGRREGPMTPRVFQNEVRAGRIRAATVVWRTGMPRWRRLGKVAVEQGVELADGEAPVPAASAAGIPPPPVPPVESGIGLSTGMNPLFEMDFDLPPPTVKPVQKPARGIALERFDGISPPFEYGGFWVRFLAISIDIMLSAMVLAVATTVLGSLAMDKLQAAHEADFSTTAAQTAYIGALQRSLPVMFLLGLYPILTTWWLGGTFGKLVCGLRVVRADGGALSLARCAARELLRMFVSGGLFFVGFLLATFNSEKKALHDVICGTRVVKRG